MERHTKKNNNYAQKALKILSNADAYHALFYKGDKFRGPSLYFSRKALESRCFPPSKQYLEYIYATLTAWGMHRMGPNGAKMQDFEVFAESIQKLQKDINDVKNLELKDLKHSKPAIAKLKCIFKGINIMKSGTKLVGNSKVMAHLFPQLIPPIDREYTLSLIHNGNKSIKNDPDAEWETMINILSHFFLPIASETRFQKKAKKWLNNPEQCYWDTSVPKIIDNLIIGAKPRRRKHKREA